MPLNLDYVKMQHIEAIKIEHSFCDSNNDESKKKRRRNKNTCNILPNTTTQTDLVYRI